VVAVFQATKEAVLRARRGEGPTLVECKTYRHKGHSRFDPATYRPKEEVEEWLSKDPITRLKRQLLQEGTISNAVLAEMEKEVTESVEAAAQFAKKSSFPLPGTALEGVYV